MVSQLLRHTTRKLLPAVIFSVGLSACGPEKAEEQQKTPPAGENPMPDTLVQSRTEIPKALFLETLPG